MMHLIHKKPCFPFWEKIVYPVHPYSVNWWVDCSQGPQQEPGNQEMELRHKSSFSLRITFVSKKGWKWGKKDYFEPKEKLELLLFLPIELCVLGILMHKESGPLRKRKYPLKTLKKKMWIAAKLYNWYFKDQMD